MKFSIIVKALPSTFDTPFRIFDIDDNRKKEDIQDHCMATAHLAFDTSRLYHCEARPPLASVHGERASDVFTDHSIVLRVPASSRPPLQLNKAWL